MAAANSSTASSSHVSRCLRAPTTCCNGSRTRASAQSRHQRFRPGADRTDPQPRLPRLLQRRMAALDRIQHRRRPAALHLAGTYPATDQTDQPARPARLLQLRWWRTDHRRHLASSLQRGASGADRPGRNPARCTQCLRPVPSTGTPRRQRLDGRLLLPQQRRHRRSGIP